jgi:Flp pilus assembly protein TadD
MPESSLQPLPNERKPSRRRIYPFRIAALLSALFFLTSCAALQGNKDGGANLERQIELQQAQHELTTEPAVKEQRTAAEFEEQGNRYLMTGDISRAYMYFTKGLAVEPENVSLLYKQGNLLLQKNKFFEAEIVFAKLLTLNSNDALSFEGRGKAYYGLGKLKEAEQDFLAALAKNPELWQSSEFLGLVHGKRQEYDQAINRLQTALSFQPQNASIKNNLAVTYYLNGNFKEAAFLLKGTAKTSNDKKVYNNLALACFQLGLYDEAMEAFRRGADNEAVAYNNIGYQFLSQKKYQEAIQAFEKAIELYPKFYPSAHKNLEIARHEMAKAAPEAESK